MAKTLILGLLVLLMHGVLASAQETLPDGPQNVHLSLYDVGLTLTWDDYPGAVGYKVARVANESDLTTTQVSAAGFLDPIKKLDPSKVYRYGVVALLPGGRFTKQSLAPEEGRLKGLGEAFRLKAPADGKPVPSPRPKLEWERLIPATGYVVKYGASADFPDGAFKREAKASDAPSFVIDHNLEPGQTYKWNVAAVTPSGDVSSTNGPFTFKEQELFDSVKTSTGLSLQRSFGDEGDATKGATFSVTHAVPTPAARKRARESVPQKKGLDDVKASVDGILIWDPDVKPTLLFGSLNARPEVSFEAHTASDDSSSEDAMRLRAGYNLSQSFGPDNLITGWVARVNGKYEFDRRFDTQKITVEALASPNIPTWGIGQQYFFDKSMTAEERSVRELHRGLSLEWRPYVGFEAGRALDQVENAPESRTILRVEAKVVGMLILNDLTHLLRANQVDIFAEETAYYLPLEHDREDFHNFLTTGVEVALTKNFGVTFTYKIGEDSPTYKKVDTYNLGLSFKF